MSCVRRVVTLAFGIGAIAGCGGPSTNSKIKLNGLIAQRNYVGAAQYLNEIKDGEYGKTNSVIYHLNLGTVLHHGRRYRESDREFALAERRMDELYTKSISKTTGTYLVNDTTTDYRGAPYEKVLTNGFRALNYLALRKPDEALAETKKAEDFLQSWKEGHEGKHDVHYVDDAFVRWLGAVLYEDAGQNDDARISREAAEAAFTRYERSYGTPRPQLEQPEDPETGEIVFVHYNGVAPRKVGKSFQVAWNRAVAMVNESGEQNAQFQNALRAGVTGNAITVAYPTYVQDGYLIRGSRVIVDGQVVPTVLVEDIGAIAIDELKDHIAEIKTRAIVRAAIKFAITKAAQIAAQRLGGGLAGFAAGVTGSVVSAATEIADTRSWSALPREIRLARVRVPPGAKQVNVQFIDEAGQVVREVPFTNVTVEKGRHSFLTYRTAL